MKSSSRKPTVAGPHLVRTHDRAVVLLVLDVRDQVDAAGPAAALAPSRALELLLLSGKDGEALHPPAGGRGVMEWAPCQSA